MSVEAISWALGQPMDRSSTKFVLVAMANCADGVSMTCFPSIDYLREATCQDRKTVLENIKRLIDLGYLSDTGERKGRTHQITVYRLNKEIQKRNSSEIGTVPKTEAKSPVFPIKESRFSSETVPKTGHGTVNEPSVEPSGNQKTARAKPAVVPVAVLVEAGFDEKTAREFIATKAERKAPLTPRAWADHCSEARAAGWSVQQAAEKVMAKTWKGFEAKYVERERPPSRSPPEDDAVRRAAKTAEAKRLLFGNQREIIDA